ncbi:MAG TPA: hypothetical protein VEY30_14530 [Myxococcaceae bacterium]|nr:hypothetical protein [Myxococcaceae bacterium]
MSVRRADQLVEAGLWLRMSGDAQGARRLFEQALALEPAHLKAQELLHEEAPEPAPMIHAPLLLDRVFAEGPLWGPGREAPEIEVDPAGAGSAMDLLVGSSEVPIDLFPPTPKDSSRAEADALLGGARDLMELDDHSGAMELLQKALTLAPGDAAVLAMRARSEATLQAMFESKLGPLHAVPQVKLSGDDVLWLNLDHRAGFVLAQIDGGTSFDDLFALSGMSRLDTARILAQLVQEGVISVE